jgi:hypothetical protein
MFKRYSQTHSISHASLVISDSVSSALRTTNGLESCLKRLLEVGDDVVDVLGADRDTDAILGDTGV